MPGWKASAVRALLGLSSASVLGIALIDPAPRFVHGQEPVPKLPATKVEATPTPGQPATADPTPPFNPNDFPQQPPTGGMAPLSGGGLFGSAPADGYRAESSTTGTITNIPQISFPGVVSVVPTQTIADQQILRVDDMLRDIPTAVKTFDAGFRPDAFLLRGFEVRARDYRWNGYRDFSPAPRDFANVQRVEILQGPSSVLYGSGQPSGVINFITKKPYADNVGYADIQPGNFGLVRTTEDINGMIDCDGRWLIRGNFAYLDTDSFRDFGYERRLLANPSLTYIVDKQTSINVEFQYLHDRRLFDTGVVAFGGTPTSNLNLINAGVGLVGGNPALVPSNRFLGQPTDFQQFDDYKSAITLVHDFGNDWWLRVGGFVGWHSSPSLATQPTFFGNDPRLAPLAQVPPPFGPVTFSPSTLIRTATDVQDFREQGYDFIANLAGTVNTGDIKHNFLLGYEFFYFNSNFRTFLSDPFTTFTFGPFTFPTGASSPINIFNPVYTNVTPPLPGQIDAFVSQANNGLYLQDFIELNENWKILAGVRYDIAFQSFSQQGTIFNGGQVIPIPLSDSNQHDYRWSPRVGLVFEPVPKVLSFYGAYTQSFDPAATGIFQPGTTLMPETSQSGEGGFKADLLDRRLSILATGYYTQKENVVTQSDFIFSTQIGVQRAQGFEASAVGRVTDRWSIISNYGYVDSRILQSGVAAQVGQRFRNVPYNNFNIWNRYNLLQDCNQTFGLALGTVYVGNRAGDLVDSFQLPGYTRWDGGVFYQRKALTANLYLENIFDRNYYVGSLNSLAVFPGAPFTVRAAIGVNF